MMTTTTHVGPCPVPSPLGGKACGIYLLALTFRVHALWLGERGRTGYLACWAQSLSPNPARGDSTPDSVGGA